MRYTGSTISIRFCKLNLSNLFGVELTYSYDCPLSLDIAGPATFTCHLKRTEVVKCLQQMRFLSTEMKANDTYGIGKVSMDVTAQLIVVNPIGIYCFRPPS